MKLTWCALLGLLISMPLSGQLPTADCAGAQQRLDSAEQRLQDWPQLSRYAAANAALLAPGAEEKRVVFFGDSITDGFFSTLNEVVPDPDYPASWPAAH